MSDKPIRINSRLWTGETASTGTGTAERWPPRENNRRFDLAAFKAMSAPFSLTLAAGAALAIDNRSSGTRLQDYAVSAAPWHDWTTAGFWIVVLVGIATLFVAKRVCRSKRARRPFYLLALAIVIAGFVQLRQVGQAHASARPVGPGRVLLLRNLDNCGRKYGVGGRSQARDLGPCFHRLAMIGRDAAYEVNGYDMAFVRDCVLVQRVADPSGFAWDRVVDRRSLKDQVDADKRFSQAAVQECLDGRLFSS